MWAIMIHASAEAMDVSKSLASLAGAPAAGSRWAQSRKTSRKFNVMPAAASSRVRPRGKAQAGKVTVRTNEAESEVMGEPMSAIM